jgi:hypothetical protein
VFFLQQLLTQGLAGIDRTGIIATVTTIGYIILLIGFMLALYQAAFRGGDLQGLGAAAVKYVAVAIVLANWTTVFHDINNAFGQLAQFIANSAGAGDVFSSWLTQLQQQFATNAATSFLKLVVGSAAAVITALLILVSYILFVVSLLILSFFYTLYGCVLYVVGPLVLALLPFPGVGGLATSFATNLFIWNSWVVLYAIFGALITAIHLNDVNTLFGQGFLGFLAGNLDVIVLGMVSVFYAIALLLIPKIAKSLIAGDVGVTVSSLVRAGAAAAGAGISIAAGAEAGAGAGASAAGAGGGGASGGAGSPIGGGAGAGVGAASSTPPPQPSLANTIRAGVGSAVSGNIPPSPSAGVSGNGAGESSSSPPSQNGGGSGASPQSGKPQPFRGSLLQTTAFHAARIASQAVHKAASGANHNQPDEKNQP